MAATWLTVAALAERLGRAESTIRLWRDRYRAFVPERRDEAGRKIYPLARIEEIAALASQRLTPREIGAELERRHGGQAEQQPVAESFQTAVLGRLDRIERLLHELLQRSGIDDEEPR